MANEFIIPKICPVSVKKYWLIGLIFVDFHFGQKSDMKPVILEPSGTKKSFQCNFFPHNDLIFLTTLTEHIEWSSLNPLTILNCQAKLYKRNVRQKFTIVRQKVIIVRQKVTIVRQKVTIVRQNFTIVRQNFTIEILISTNFFTTKSFFTQLLTTFASTTQLLIIIK